jgi:predicted house-cleaning noncanonical NTP pyrophosphatase (MazG superfamily)
VIRQMTPPRRLVKLVRDGIADGLGNLAVAFLPLKPEDHAKMLRAKLIEEVGEYLEAPSMGELADIYEVVRTLAQKAHGRSLDDLVDLAQRKREDVGGFDQAMGLYVGGRPDG